MYFSWKIVQTSEMRELVTHLLQGAPSSDKLILSRVSGLQFLFFHAGLKSA